MIEFPDNQQERRLRQILDASEGDILQERLQEITELYFVGTMSPKSTKGLEVAEDGSVTMNTIPVKQGSVSNLKLVYMMPNLKHLAVVNQPLKDISGMKDLVLLLDLNLACTQVSDLSGMTNLPSLQTLNLERLEQEAIERAMQIAGGNVTRAAELLGITRFALYRKLNKS